jgi:tetratricopeptide (TPR) repeat protein
MNKRILFHSLPIIAFAVIAVIVSCYTVPKNATLSSQNSAETDGTQKRSNNEIFLQGDSYEITSLDFAEYESFLGRTPHQSQAWAEIRNANSQWRKHRQLDAISSWMRIASEYNDTDAAYAALTNVGAAHKSRGEIRKSIEALQLLILIPPPPHKDVGMEYHNYRHDACVALADYYESTGHTGLAKRFLSQAIDVDQRYDWCGVFAISALAELQGRLAKLSETQSISIEK